MEKTVDHIHERLTTYASNLLYDRIPSEAVHAAKVRIIDTFGALIGGFSDEPGRIARAIAADAPCATGATVVGTSMKTTPEIAAFINATTSRSMEMNDYSRKPGGRHGHPSDVVMPVFASGEHVGVSGREYITGVVLAYEIYGRLAEVISSTAFDNVAFCCVGSACAAGKMLGLSPRQLGHCVSIAVVANNPLRQTRVGDLTMWKAMATGEAGRAGVFAAMLARKGVEGPYLPFEGKDGWCNHVAHKKFALDTMGDTNIPFAVQQSVIKPRAAYFHALAPIIAAEKVAAELEAGIRDIQAVTIEIYGKPRPSNPDSRESADHSIPYNVAVALMDGTVTHLSFNDQHLWNPELRALLQKIEVVENKDFTAANERVPVQYRARVTVRTSGGKVILGESGGEHGGLSHNWSDAQVGRKFLELTENVLGAKKASYALERLWNLEDVSSIAAIPPVFVIE